MTRAETGNYCGFFALILVWPTCWTASCSTLIVCGSVCVSGQYHKYCSAHDEWLIMKLCMYVRYHTANNVSNFGGDPVTQLYFITIFNVMSPYCSAHVAEWLRAWDTLTMFEATVCGRS